VLVFVSRKDLADQIAYQFNQEGFEAESMHGGRTQDKRMQVLQRFRDWNVRLLVTTDVMGRGLDIPTISHVVIFDMGDIDDYVHRIGRTARGPYGMGHALTLFEYNEKWPHLAEGLVVCLEHANQEVPEDLQRIADEVQNGERTVKAMKGKWGAASGWQGDAKAAALKALGYDSNTGDLFFSDW